VDFIAQSAHAEEGQQVMTVRAYLSNPDGVLKPELTGFAKIYCGPRRIIEVMTRRIGLWIRTEIWALRPWIFSLARGHFFAKSFCIFAKFLYSAVATGTADPLPGGTISLEGEIQCLVTDLQGLETRPVNLPQARKQRIRFPTKISWLQRQIRRKPETQSFETNAPNPFT
jgi:hypothetical protein